MDSLYRQLGGQVLGIIPNDLTQEIGGELVEGLMDIILDIRQQYRDTKGWDQADALRRRLTELGIVVEDQPEGPAGRVERGGG